MAPSGFEVLEDFLAFLNDVENAEPPVAEEDTSGTPATDKHGEHGPTPRAPEGAPTGQTRTADAAGLQRFAHELKRSKLLGPTYKADFVCFVEVSSVIVSLSAL